MDTIKGYLENMFMNLPNTPEVQRAKQELWQIMEDKYTDLKEEGKSENEAVGIVISEFGNLEEMAESLGISGMVKQEWQEAGFSLEEVKRYLGVKSKSALLIASGVCLIILSVCGPIIGDWAGRTWKKEVLSVGGIAVLFLAVSVAVGLFVYSSVFMKEWERVEKNVYTVDFATIEYIKQRRNGYRMKHALLLMIGIGFCIMSVIPVILLDAIFGDSGIWGECSAVFLFLMVAAGVFLIVLTGIEQEGYDTMMKLCKSGGIAVSEKQPSPESKAEGILSLYWPTVTSIYLCWSFLTFWWNITWIIWPVSAILYSLIAAWIQPKQS